MFGDFSGSVPAPNQSIKDPSPARYEDSNNLERMKNPQEILIFGVLKNNLLMT